MVGPTAEDLELTTRDESKMSHDAFADQLIDELMPEELDWRRLVTSYPLTSLAVAATGGYLLARARGALMVSALGAFASDTVSRNVNALIGEDVL